MFDEAYGIINDQNEFSKKIEEIKKLSNDEKRAFARGIIESGTIDKITNGNSVYLIISDQVMVSELIGTKLLTRFINGCILSPNLQVKESTKEIIRNLSISDFNKLFQEEYMKSLIDEMSAADFIEFLKPFSEIDKRYLQNETLISKLLSLSDEELLTNAWKLKRNSNNQTFNELYETIDDSSIYYTLIEEIQKRFFEMDNPMDNIKNIDLLSGAFYLHPDILPYNNYRSNNEK